MWVMGLVVAVLILVVVVRLVRSSPPEFYHEAEDVRPEKEVGRGLGAQDVYVPRCEEVNDRQWLDEMGIGIGKGVRDDGGYSAC